MHKIAHSSISLTNLTKNDTPTFPSPRTRAKVISESKPLLTARLKCKVLWHALQISDFTKSGVLSPSTLKTFFEKQSDHLSDLLCIQSSDDLLTLFDRDQDGFLNESEQLLIFSAIKARMQSSAESLCEIHNYSLFREMMRAVRALEDDIYEYKKVLKSKVYRKELEMHSQDSEDKVKRFLKKWEEKFERFENECQEKIQELEAVHQEQRIDLEAKMACETWKVKPKAILQTLQVKEKLVAVCERLGEAQMIKTELKSLKLSESKRIKDLVHNEQEKYRKRLARQQKKELEIALAKQRETYNSMVIEKESARMLLDKKIRLQRNDIAKSQKIFGKVEKNRDELWRTKDKTRKVQEYLSDWKSVKSHKKQMSSLSGLSQTLRKNEKRSLPSIFSLNFGEKGKESVEVDSKWKIAGEGDGEEVFDCGVKRGKSKLAFGKILGVGGRGGKSLSSLTALYNEKLQILREI